MKSKQAKAMQKLIRNREGNDAYDSEDEENPYLSEVRIVLTLGANVPSSILRRKRKKRKRRSSPRQHLQSSNSNRRLRRGLVHRNPPPLGRAQLDKRTARPLL